jgi:hypothetical protein
MTLATALARLAEVATRLEQGELSLQLDSHGIQLANGRFSLAVLGEFKRGKSTLINALLGEEVLPTDVLPTTATLNRLVYSLEKRILLHKHDATIEEIPWGQLARYVTKLDDEAADRALSIREAVVEYPCSFCRNNVELIDTPGLQDEEAMTSITLSVLPKVDAAVLVISALSPLSESELSFLESLSTQKCGRIFLVISSVDRLGLAEDELPAQLQRLCTTLKNRLSQRVPGLLKRLHPEFFPLSAYQALRARQANDGKALVASGFPAFEAALTDFLGADRGHCALAGPLSVALQSLMALRIDISQRSDRRGEQAQKFEQTLRRAETAATARYDGPAEPIDWPESELGSADAPWAVELWELTRSGASQEMLAETYERGVKDLSRQVFSLLCRRWDRMLDRMEAQWSRHSESSYPARATALAVCEQLGEIAAGVGPALRTAYPFPLALSVSQANLAELARSQRGAVKTALAEVLHQAADIFARASAGHRQALEIVAHDRALEQLAAAHRDRAEWEVAGARLKDLDATLDDIEEDLGRVTAALEDWSTREESASDRG